MFEGYLQYKSKHRVNDFPDYATVCAKRVGIQTNLDQEDLQA